MATLEEVRSILPVGSQLTDVQLTMAINAADCMLSSVECSCSGHASIYLAAHFAAVTENTLSVTREKDDCSGSDVTYGFTPGAGLKGSPFGQAALGLCPGLAQADTASSETGTPLTPINMKSLGCL